jgi:hypothetical protein
MHEERIISPARAVLLLALAFAAIYSPLQLGDRELRWREGFHGAMVQEMDLARPNTVAHGEVISGEYPLYPWLVALVWRGGQALGVPMSLAFSLRLVSVLALAGIAVAVGYAGHRAVGGQAGMVAAAACGSMFLPMEKALEGYPETLAVLWLCLAWMSWFGLGVARGAWGRAWLVSLAFCGLAFYTAGWLAVFLFAFPLFWLRRPMGVWRRRPHLPGLAAGLAVLLGFVLLWGLPRWLAGGVVFRQIQIDAGVFSGNYVEQLLAFPLVVAFRLLPWTALAWPSFCAAYEPVDPNPLFSRFVKTVFVVLSCCLWINPYFSTRDLLVLVPLLALLTGHHYALLVRRHGDALHRLVRPLAVAGMAMAVGILLFYVVPPELWQDLSFRRLDLGFRESFRWQGMGLAVVALGAGAYLALRPGRHPVWCHLLAVCAIGMLCYWALFDPYRAQDCAKAELGLAIRGHVLHDLGLPPDGDLPPGLVVYKGPRTQGLYNEGGYLGCLIRRVNRYQELPPEAEAVYVLCVVVPVHPSRQWGVPLMRTDYAGRRLYLYKGIRAKTGEESKP